MILNIIYIVLYQFERIKIVDIQIMAFSLAYVADNLVSVYSGNFQVIDTNIERLMKFRRGMINYLLKLTNNEFSADTLIRWFQKCEHRLKKYFWLHKECFDEPLLVGICMMLEMIYSGSKGKSLSDSEELHQIFQITTSKSSKYSRIKFKKMLLTCLYVCLSYFGSSTTYPTGPFIFKESKKSFFARALELVNVCSHQMHQININTELYQRNAQKLLKLSLYSSMSENKYEVDYKSLISLDISI